MLKPGGRWEHRWAVGSTRRRQSDTGKSRGKEGEREEVVAEEREGKMRTEHFKLTQNSIVKDKSRGKIQLKGISTTFHQCKEITQPSKCAWREAMRSARMPRAPRDYWGFSAVLSPSSLGMYLKLLPWTDPRAGKIIITCWGTHFTPGGCLAKGVQTPFPLTTSICTHLTLE